MIEVEDRATGAARPLRRRSPGAVLACGLSIVVLSLLAGGTSLACVGPECMEVWSTENGGGALTIYWDFAHRKIQTFGFCLAGKCLYSTIDIGFITTGDAPPDGYHAIADGTEVKLEIVAIDPAVVVKSVNGFNLSHAGDAAVLGTAPTLHVHPSWQINVPDGTPLGDYPLSFKLTTSTSVYTESQVFSVMLTNLPTPTPNAPTPTATPTATPTSTPAPPPCPGDCDGDGRVTVAELMRGVTGTLANGVACLAFDPNRNGKVTISELVAAVNAALNGCPMLPTPTATVPAMLDEIQRTIFSPRCAIPTCHDADGQVGNLVLDTAHNSYAQLVSVAPNIDTAHAAGFLRVDPGHPENSFLLVKLQGPPPGEGQRMPEVGSPLTDAEVELIRDWIVQGAQP